MGHQTIIQESLVERVIRRPLESRRNIEVD